MGKTRDIFKKTGDTKGTFSVRMGMIQDRNSKDLLKAEETMKRWQEYRKEPYKKGLSDPNNHGGVVTHIESDILECEVKWNLGNIVTKRKEKLVEVMEFQLSFFKS